MTREERDEVSEKLLKELSGQIDPRSSFVVKMALLDAYSRGVMDGIDRMAKALKEKGVGHE